MICYKAIGSDPGPLIATPLLYLQLYKMLTYVCRGWAFASKREALQPVYRCLGVYQVGLVNAPSSVFWEIGILLRCMAKDLDCVSRCGGVMQVGIRNIRCNLVCGDDSEVAATNVP